MKKSSFTLLVFLLVGINFANAQRSISGKVTDESDGSPLSGVSVILKGANQGTVTDQDGIYSMKIASDDQVIVFSYIGFETKEEQIQKKSVIDVKLKLASLNLGEVVVTALGIKRDKKALGYSTQEIRTDDINQTNSVNFINSLTGKVAGVQITGSGNGLTSSSRVVIRGDKSLNLENNSPLIVVDGIPMNDNLFGLGGCSTCQANLPADFGSGLSDLNQEDIESINVLKGAAASALYGSRAANGVILITTKSGNIGKGFSVNVNSSTMFSDALRLWDVQDKYGAGVGGVYEPGADTNFGPKLDGSTVVAQNGSPGFYPKGKTEALPLVFRYDLNDFFQKGLSLDNSIGIAGNTDRLKFRFGYNNTKSYGIVPNTDLSKNNFSTKVDFSITPKWKFNTSINYINSSSDNLLVSGYGSQGIMYNLIWSHTNVDLDWMKDYWYIKDQEQNRMFSWGDNIFKIAHENINSFNRNRLLGNISTTYDFNQNLSLTARVGSDYFNEFRVSRRPVGSSRYPSGSYREQAIDFKEINSDLFMTYSKSFDIFSVKASIGANKMNQFTSDNFIEGKGLSIPGYYNLQNVNVTPSMARNIYKKQINSVFAFVNIGYKNYMYVDITGRNDWSSTLPIENNSYFYPSVSLSFIPTSVFNFNKSINYMKLRLNYAIVGNDTDPYKLSKTYSNATLPGTLTNPSQISNSDLKPEINNSFEAGLELQMFNSILLLDFTYYKNSSKNQILGIDISKSTGFSSLLINAGLIENQGIEATLGFKPIKNKNLEWSIQTNFTTNRSKVKELVDGIENYVIAWGPNGGRIEARVGGRMGDIYGYGYLRNSEGKIIYDKNGSPQMDPVVKKWGNYNPDWVLGISNGLKYKNISLYFLFDYRHGGLIYSATHAIGMESGLLVGSLYGRETGIVGEGVVLNADGSYSPNTTVASPELWYYDNAYARSNLEANSFDATYLKLRELSLTVSLPRKWASVIRAHDLSISLTGNNLALWTKVPHIDPETHSMEGGRLTPGFEVMQLPSARNYGFKLNVNF
jgi:TonB-linked SusC/RagA family outer membrane protein